MRSFTRPIRAATVVLTMCVALRTTSAQNPGGPWAGPPGPAPGRYAEVNGIRLYYEIHGSGEPLVLLHGGLGAGSMFGSNLPALAKTHRVIVVDLQGHGRTADIDRPFSFESMSDDIVTLLAQLRIPKADLMGFSLGGGVAMVTASRHPELVRKLVLVSTVLRANAYYPEMRALQNRIAGPMADEMRGTPMYDLYMTVAPRKQDFPRLLDRIGAFMKRDIDYTRQFAALKVPTLIVAGDADMFPPSHAVEAFGLLDGGKKDGGWDGAGRSKLARLAILPGATHYDIFAKPALGLVAAQFLDEP